MSENKHKCSNCAYYNIGIAKKCNIIHQVCSGWTPNFNLLNNTISSLRQQLAEKEKEIEKWIRIAGENQRSANKSADWAEKAEAELAELREKLKGIEAVYKKYYKPDGNYGEAENYEEYINSVKELAEDCWQAIKQAVEK